MVKHNGVLYRAADAHAHIYPGKIAEKATENVGRFYDLLMAEVGLPHVLNEEGTAVGFDKFLVCSVADKSGAGWLHQSLHRGQMRKIPEVRRPWRMAPGH